MAIHKFEFIIFSNIVQDSLICLDRVNQLLYAPILGISPPMFLLSSLVVSSYASRAVVQRLREVLGADQSAGHTMHPAGRQNCQSPLSPPPDHHHVVDLPTDSPRVGQHCSSFPRKGQCRPSLPLFGAAESVRVPTSTVDSFTFLLTLSW